MVAMQTFTHDVLLKPQGCSHEHADTNTQLHSCKRSQFVTPAFLIVDAHLVKRGVTLPKVLLCTVDIIGHNMGDSCSRAISSGSGSQIAALVPLMAS